MKTLVADEDLVSRKKMNLIMKSLGECVLVDNTQDAITAFEQAWNSDSPFDLVTLDIYMHEMDGKEALNKIRQLESGKGVARETQVKIFMLTTYCDKDTIISCVKEGCDDVIIKPFDKSTILKKLVVHGLLEDVDCTESYIGSDSSQGSTVSGKKEGVLKEIITQFKRGEIDLPALPRIQQKYRELVGAGANLQEIADLLKQDAAISSKLISISNSSYYRGMVENKTLDQAIGRLGLETTRQTVNAIANRSLYVTRNKKYTDIVEALWEHSLSCAYASQLVLESLNLTLRDDAFTMGLFHDIGKLVLVQVVGEIEEKDETGQEIDPMELFETMDTYHGQTGSALLKKWGFSPRFISVAEDHDNPASADSIPDELKLVYCANLLVKTMGYGQREPLKIDLAADEVAQELGLDEMKITEVKKNVTEQMDELKKYLE